MSCTEGQTRPSEVRGQRARQDPARSEPRAPGKTQRGQRPRVVRAQRGQTDPARLEARGPDKTQRGQRPKGSSQHNRSGRRKSGRGRHVRLPRERDVGQLTGHNAKDPKPKDWRAKALTCGVTISAERGTARAPTRELEGTPN